MSTATKPAAKAKRPNGTKPAAEPAADAFGGTVTIPGRAKPSAVCSKDRTRPILCHARLVKHKDGMWLCATDSYSAVAIKVTGTAVEGWIPAAALRLMERGKDGTQISETAWQVTTNDGLITFDIALDVKGGTFPDFAKVGLWDDPEKPGSDCEFGINPTLLRRVAEGIGAADSGVKITVSTPLKAIRVESRQLGVEHRALVMPVRVAA